MTAQQDFDLVLNIVPITFNSKEIIIGRTPKLDKEGYRQLRENHWKTHSFRYDNRTDEILNVPLSPDLTPIGKIDKVSVNEHLLLVARSIQQNILVWLANSLPILRNDKKLVFWGQTDSAFLLSRAVEKVGVKKISGLEVALRYEIDCRMFRNKDDQLYLGIVIDVLTSNIIDIPVSELQKQGLLINGRYICRRRELDSEYLKPKLELLGKVSGMTASQLLLTDTEGVDRIDIQQAFLEPRLEYLNDVIRLYYDSKAIYVISALDSFRKPISTPLGKLALIKETLKGIKKRSIVISDSVVVTLGELLIQKDERFPDEITTQRPPLLFGPQGRNRGTYPDNGITSYGPYMYMQHERNSPLIAVICEARYRGRVEQFIRSLRDGFPNELWMNQQKSNPYELGLIGKFRLSKVRFEIEECSNFSPQAYKEAINKLLNRLPETPDLAIVQIKESFMSLYGNNNPYYVSKAGFMIAGVPTQSIRIEKIEMPNENLPYLLNNIGLATYAKLDGIPWVMSTAKPTTHEIVVGLGSAEVSIGRGGAKTRYVGITSVFQGDGRYLVWGVTREVEFEHYAQALLESLRAVVKYVQQQNAWQDGDNVRLVCHVYKRLKDSEVEAITILVRELIDSKFKVEFAFLDISWQHPYHIFAPSQKGVSYWDWQSKTKKMRGIGVPQRGLCLQLDNSRGLLHLTGPGDVKTDTQGIPKPLLIELHRDSDFTDMTYLLRQIYHFTYMSWRDFFPSTEPVTITYSRLIAKLLGNLKTIDGWNSQVLSVGSLRDRRWFL
jgi:hypothetical protein